MNDPNNNSHSTGAPSVKKRITFNQRLSFWLVILLVVALVGLMIQLNIKNKANPTIPLPSVVAAPVRTQDVPVYFSALGSVTPTYSVTVRTQINGQLMRVLFREGQLVKAGDLLAQIDDRTYQAQLMQYEGQLARDTAQLANAEIDLKRYQKLWRQDSVAQQVLATQAALVKQLEGSIELDKGLIAAVKVNLQYTQIASPIAGRIGLRLVDPGNFVQTSDTNGIAVVNMLNPITVIFSIAEDRVPKVLPKVYADRSLTVEAFNRDQTKLLATGKLLTIDNQIDPTTGTVRLKAQFDNENNILFPNQFVNIRLLVNTLHNALVVPTAAVQHGEQGTFVYVLTPDHIVHTTMVKTGVSIEDITVIKSGLTSNQQVVVDGTDKLTDGAKVKLPDLIAPKGHTSA